MRVAVVGGGVVGLSCAFALRRGGAEVTVYERGRVGEGCSRGNTGWICPGLSAPLPAPGVMGGALRGMLHRDSPLLISPLLGPSFLRWSWGFWRASSAERYRAGLEATVALTKSAFADYDELRAAGVEFEMHSPGMLVAALTEPGLDEYAAMLTEAEEAGYEGPVRVISGDEARELDPALSEAVIGGVHAPSERYVRPESVSQGLAAWLRANGADGGGEHRRRRPRGPGRRRRRRGGGRLVGRAPRRESLPDGGGEGLQHHREVGRQLAAPRALSLRGQGRDEHLRRRAAEDRGHLRPDRDRRVAEAQADRRDRALVRRLPEDWGREEVELEWAGLRPYPSDGLPVIGPVPGREGLYVATGHGRMGITLGPVTGKLLAQVILDGASPRELEPFRIERFR